MTGYSAFKTTYILQTNNDVVGKTDPNSVDTGDVGNIGITLANGLEQFIDAINAFVFYTGTADPPSILGNENDVYFQTNGGTSIVIWRKDTTDWAVQATVPLGISYNDGIIIGLRTQIDTATLSVEVSSGNWAINNVIYGKSIPTFINYDAQPVGSDRIDTIYATTSGTILYLAGAPSGSPVKPTLPANTIEVDSIYVPADGTGLPYLFSAGQGGSSSGGATSVNYLPSDLVADGDGYYLPITIPDGRTLAGSIYTVTSGARSFPGGLQLTEAGTAITGFLNNTMDTITIKLI